MSIYKIPEPAYYGYSVLIKSPKKKLESLLTELKKAPKATTPENLAEFISDKGIYNERDSLEVVRVLFGLYRLREHETKKNTKEFIDEVYKSIEDTKKENLKPQPFFKECLGELITIQTLAATNKAVDLRGEYDKIFVDSRIISDIRPSFYDDVKKGFEIGAIVHNLRIEYHHGNKPHGQIFLALDNNDLSTLKDQILRAEEKEKSLRTNFKNISFVEVK